MDDVAMMQIFDCSASLDQKPSNLGHGEELASLEGVGKRAVGTYFQNHIGTLLERERADELDNVGMFEFGMKLELGNELENTIVSIGVSY